MNEAGWRVIQIQSGAEVGITGQSLCVRQEEECLVPLGQIRSVIIESQNVSISVKAASEMAKARIQLIICDEKHNPLCETVPYHGHSLSAANLRRQAGWESSRKADLWSEIVRQKLVNQQRLMEAVAPGSGRTIMPLLNHLTPGDSGNCEATGAGLHFRTVFGRDFSRSRDCLANAALNYGYSILLSSVNRAVAVYGYKSELGIRHCSEVNPFNLSCDFMEPFRPIVDAAVVSLGTDEGELTSEHRHQLLAWQYDTVLLDGRHYTAHDAVDIFVKDCLDYMNGERDRVREVNCFE